MKKAPIVTEVVDFLETYDVSGVQLATTAGVTPVVISRLRNGRRSDVLSANADALRLAMAALKQTAALRPDPWPPTATPTTVPEASQVGGDAA